MGLASSDRPWLVDGARTSHEQLERTLARLTEPQAREPSRLPGWTRGHLLTHLARNADSHVRLLKAAQRGELADQYEGGKEGRAADIELGAIRDSGTLVKDALRSSSRLMALWAGLRGTVWERTVSTNRGPQPAWRLAWSRWRELEIHHVDLDLGYEPDAWPQRFVDVMLEEALEHLPARLPAGCILTVQARATAMTGGGTTLTEHNVTGAPHRPGPTAGNGTLDTGVDTGTAASTDPDTDTGDTDVVTAAGPGAADAGTVETGSGIVTASGTTADVLAWLLGRTSAETPSLRFTDTEGRPTQPPPLHPWG